MSQGEENRKPKGEYTHTRVVLYLPVQHSAILNTVLRTTVVPFMYADHPLCYRPYVRVQHRRVGYCLLLPVVLVLRYYRYATTNYYYANLRSVGVLPVLCTSSK